ncbi:MAG TPA: primosomal protein N' (replication factor Y) - superfamily II helicase [Campylobacteraceae bacterium]|nr:primosomal protein N' (replication factor Y) - superfamily II helicase [Campylobacteraceae bacterium]HHD83648.1 primosomal protein N' (replication factor Y) - superfamily II helicase [Campylobacteraceae bacterium]
MAGFTKVMKGTPFTQKTFPCKSCGASLVFSADDVALKCEYCGAINYLYPPRLPIYEQDLDKALARIETSPRYDLQAPREIKCPVCAATFTLEPHTRSTRCPYCNAPIVTNLDIFMPLAPESLLPFKIDQKKAKEIFRKWVGSLWFAPSGLEKYTRSDARFEGIYLPYWTFDADTTTHFQGYRGDTYYERVSRRVFIDGRERIVEEMEPRIEWTPVQGEVQRHFDDILIGATKTLPRKLADSLQPWDLENLIPYDDKYLSGFESETYSVALDDGFDYAKEYMAFVVREAVRARIGGDHQKISYMQIYHDNKSFKYILLPVWTAHFQYKKREYRFAINARTGTIKGERPYSSWKIFFALLFALILLGTLFFMNEHPEAVGDFLDNVRVLRISF